MTGFRPLLQIIHVSDLHVSRDVGDKPSLNGAEEMRARLWAREKLESFDLFDWHNGTLGHDEVACQRFENFLATTLRSNPSWNPIGLDSPPVWLVDTGDASRFGGPQSLIAAQKMHQTWQSLLGPRCMVRTLFGNHDVWPGTHPALLAGKEYQNRMGIQRDTLRSHKPWRRENWDTPLTTQPASGLPPIKCYRLNTVSFDWLDSVFAIGRVDESELAELMTTVDSQSKTPSFRILLTHHPLVYPYHPSERTAAMLKEKMVLSNDKLVLDRLRNDDTTNGPHPYVHLVLSGHTHHGQPGNKLPDNVRNIKQGTLGEDQLQLVSGSLMLLQSRGKSARKSEAVSGFTDVSVLPHQQQFQLLRFYADTTAPHGIWLQRYVFARAPGGDRFAPLAELTSDTYFNIG